MQGQKKIKIVFVIPSLHTGGSERVTIHLVRNIDRSKFDVNLVVLCYEGALIKLIPDDIKVIPLNYKRTVYSVFSLLKIAWTLKPDILFSTLGHLNLLIALLKPLIPGKTFLVARESNIISIRNKDERYPKIFDFLFKTVYKRFPCIICQSEYMANDLRENYSIPKEKMVIINNPVDFSLIPAVASISPASNVMNLISVGQLRREKGYDRLIKSLAGCTFAFEYKIIGGGPQREIQALIDSLGLQDRIRLLGAILNPYQELCASDCMLLGSYYEGFPNVVIEANACGVPVIAFSAPGGHNEIIEQGTNGWFVNTPEELRSLLETRAYEKLDKNQIANRTRERYDLQKIVLEYEDSLINKYTSWNK